MVSCAVRAEDAVCREFKGYNFPELSTNLALVIGHVTSAADRVHFVKEAAEQHGCPSRAPACTERAYLVPGDRVIISARRGAFICATYIDAKGGARLGWLLADAVALDKTEPVTLADWLGEWHHKDGADEGDITVKAGKAGALRIVGTTTYGGNDPGRAERGDIITAAIESEVTPAGDRLSFVANDCKMWMQRLGAWLVANDDGKCGGDGATFRGVYTRLR
jgi:hypothetical protein